MLHVTITQNGETLVDADTKVLIGAYDKDENSTAELCFIDMANATEVAATMDGAESAVQSGMKAAPAVAMLRMMKGLVPSKED